MLIRRLQWPTGSFMSAHRITRSMPWTLLPELNNGGTGQKAASDPHQRWRPEWSMSARGIIRSMPWTPTQADGVVYVGSHDHRLYALDARTGDMYWSYTTGGFIDSSPTVAEGVVYVGSQDHKLYALSAQAGENLWNYATGGSIVSSPVVANGVVFVGSNDHNLYAFNQTAILSEEM